MRSKAASITWKYCGCYHEFFLSHRLRLRKDLPSAYFEAPLLPQPAPEQQPLVLRIAHCLWMKNIAACLADMDGRRSDPIILTWSIGYFFVQFPLS